MGVLKELKELVKEMGGNASQAQTIRQAVDKIPASGGSGGAGGLKLNPVYNADNNTITLDKTAKEIADAFDEHGNVYWIHEKNDHEGISYEKHVIYSYSSYETGYEFRTLLVTSMDGQLPTLFTAESSIDYPVSDGGK